MLRYAPVLLLVTAANLPARLQFSPDSIHFADYLPKATLILRAEVLDLSPPSLDQRKRVTARLRVTRWYRGQGGSEAFLLLELGGRRMLNGHNCESFDPGTHWFLLAKEREGAMELVDDCYGAFKVSPRLAAPKSDPMAQIEADFAAGLTDSNPKGRILSLQRLGNLGMSSSQPALRSFLANSTATEKMWAAHAALRCGDITILPVVRELLEQTEPGWPGTALGNALSQVRNPAAVAGLIEILYHPAATNSRINAMVALAEIKGANTALPAIAAHLIGNDSRTRQAALNAMARITGEPACATDERLCLEWWKGVIRQ